MGGDWLMINFVKSPTIFPLIGHIYGLSGGTQYSMDGISIKKPND